MLAQLKTHHREIARLTFDGYKPLEISQRMDLSYNHVTKIINDPMCKAYIAKMEDQANEDIIAQRKRLVSLNNKAIDTIDELIDDGEVSASVRANLSLKVLELNGFHPVKEVNHNFFCLTAEDKNLLKERAAASGMIVDADYEHVKEDIT